MVFRQPVIALRAHLEALKTAEDRKHECNQLIRVASGNALEPLKVNIARLFPRAIDMYLALDSEYGGSSGRPIFNALTQEPLVVNVDDTEEYAEKELNDLKSLIDNKLIPELTKQTDELTKAKAEDRFEDCVKIGKLFKEAKADVESHMEKYQKLDKMKQERELAKANGRQLGASMEVSTDLRGGSGLKEESVKAIEETMEAVGTEMRDMKRANTEMLTETNRLLKRLCVSFERFLAGKYEPEIETPTTAMGASSSTTISGIVVSSDTEPLKDEKNDKAANENMGGYPVLTHGAPEKKVSEAEDESSTENEKKKEEDSSEEEPQS